MGGVRPRAGPALGGQDHAVLYGQAPQGALAGRPRVAVHPDHGPFTDLVLQRREQPLQ